jgi:hypothetical protein
VPPRNAEIAAPTPEAPLQRALVLAFPRDGHRSTQSRTIPRGGVLLGRGASVFDVPFDDPGMSAQHAEIRFEVRSALRKTSRRLLEAARYGSALL